MSVERRREMIEPAHPSRSITAQCRLLSISRSSFYYMPQPETEVPLALMRVIDAAFLDMPWHGSRQMARHLRWLGHDVGRWRVRRLMARMGLSPIYQRLRTSDRHPQNRVYPYLLRRLAIDRPNHVWGADVTYIPMRRGFLHLVAIMDWATAMCWPGGCQTRWTLASASGRWRAMVGRRPLIRIRAVSSPASRSRPSGGPPTSESAWTVEGAGWKMYSSNGSGVPSSANAPICTASRPARSFASD